ncbi:hypothetical protein AB0B31_11020 [Catellatospora citrea]|uniref:hypothetical protein n=1 Tax=Catellatospora citrea TaxID=53366 RepID=UPI0033EFB294
MTTSIDTAAAEHGHAYIKARFGYDMEFDTDNAADQLAARCAMLLEASSPTSVDQPGTWRDAATLHGSSIDIAAVHDHALDLLLRWLDLRLPPHQPWRPAAVTTTATPAGSPYPAQARTDRLGRILELRFTATTADTITIEMRAGQATDLVGWRRDSDRMIRPTGIRWQLYTGGHRRRIRTAQPADPILAAADDGALPKHLDELEDSAIADAAADLRAFMLAHPANTTMGLRARQLIRDDDPAVLDILSPLDGNIDPTGHVASRWNRRAHPRLLDLDPAQATDAVQLYVTAYTRTILNLGRQQLAAARTERP